MCKVLLPTEAILEDREGVIMDVRSRFTEEEKQAFRGKTDDPKIKAVRRILQRRRTYYFNKLRKLMFLKTYDNLKTVERGIVDAFTYVEPETKPKTDKQIQF